MTRLHATGARQRLLPRALFAATLASPLAGCGSPTPRFEPNVTPRWMWW